MAIPSKQDFTGRVSAYQRDILAEALSADIIQQNFQLTQSFGEMLAKFLPAVAGESPYQRYSYYSKEKCHESIHGKGTCNRNIERGVPCEGKVGPSYSCGYCLQCNTVKKIRFITPKNVGAGTTCTFGVCNSIFFVIRATWVSRATWLSG